MAGIIFGGRAQKLIISSFIRSTTKATTTPKLFCSMAANGLTILPSSSSPWLRLPKDMCRESEFVDYENFLNLADNRQVQLDMMCYVSEVKNSVCVGSSRGALAYLSGVSDYHEMNIVSPYGGGIIASFYGILNTDLSGPSATRCYTRVDNVDTFLCEPWQPLDTWTPSNYLDFYVNKSEQFEYTRYPYLFHKDDPPIAYSASTKTVYKLSRDSEHCFHIELWNVFEYPIKVKSRFYVASNFTTMEVSERELRGRCHQDRYLVVTEDSGEREPGLYLVIRHHNREFDVSETRAMDVFKFDLVERKMTQTTELDGHAFFIGRGSDPFAVKVNTCPELKTDSIYISDDLQIFDLNERSVTPFVDTGDLSITRSPTFWVSPRPRAKRSPCEQR